MRKLQSVVLPGSTVQEALDEFNERAEEFGITNEADIVTVNAMPATHNLPIATKGGSVPTKVEVVIVYWANG